MIFIYQPSLIFIPHKPEIKKKFRVQFSVFELGGQISN